MEKGKYPHPRLCKCWYAEFELSQVSFRGKDFMLIDERGLAKMKANYERMDDEKLAFIAVNRAGDLTEEARLALDEVIRHRDSEKFRALLADIEKEPSDLPQKKESEAPPSLDRSHIEARSPEIISEYKSAVIVVRWLAFLPLAWQANAIHYPILKGLGFGALNSLKESSQDIFIAYGLAGAGSAIFSILIGAWVSPLKKKTWPAIAVAVFLLAGQIYALLRWVKFFRDSTLKDAITIDAVSSISMCITVSAILVMRSWLTTAKSVERPA
jgi:hypothetical protein